MRKEIKQIGIFCIIYTLIFLLFIIAKSIIVLDADLLYHNIFIFIIILSFSQMAIFENLEIKKSYNNMDYLKKISIKIIFINLIITISILIINIILFLISNITVNNWLLFYMSIQLFLILTISSFLLLLFNNNFLLLAILIFIYYIDVSYGCYFKIFDFYYCYLKDVSIIINIEHYMFWILIILFMIYSKYIKKKR